MKQLHLKIAVRAVSIVVLVILVRVAAQSEAQKLVKCSNGLKICMKIRKKRVENETNSFNRAVGAKVIVVSVILVRVAAHSEAQMLV